MQRCAGVGTYPLSERRRSRRGGNPVRWTLCFPNNTRAILLIQLPLNQLRTGHRPFTGEALMLPATDIKGGHIGPAEARNRGRTRRRAAQCLVMKNQLTHHRSITAHRFLSSRRLSALPRQRRWPYFRGNEHWHRGGHKFDPRAKYTGGESTTAEHHDECAVLRSLRNAPAALS